MTIYAGIRGKNKIFQDFSRVKSHGVLPSRELNPNSYTTNKYQVVILSIKRNY